MSWKPLKKLEKFVRKDIGYDKLAIAAALAGAGYLAYSAYAGAGATAATTAATTAGSTAGTTAATTAATTAGTTAGATTAATTGWTTGNTLAAVNAGMQGISSYQQEQAQKKAQAEYERQQAEAEKLAMAQRKDSLTRLRKSYDTANYSVSSPQSQQGQGRIILG